MINNTFPRVRKQMAQIQMTQAELALRIGLTRVTVTRILTGRSSPTLDTCRAICRETGCTMQDFEREANDGKA